MFNNKKYFKLISFLFFSTDVKSLLNLMNDL
jgi:hypothetical protein